MKPTSIIFLIFSIILVFAGTGLCNLSEQVAIRENYSLFLQEETEDGKLITSFPIDSEIVTKLVLNLNDANITVVSGAEESRVELVNFQINTFTHQTVNGVMTIDDNVDILTLFNLTGKGTQFHGLRHYLKTSNFKPGEKSVNVYLSDDIELEELELTSLRSDISINDCHSCLSYKITTDEGDITLYNVEDAERASLTVLQQGNVAIQLSSINNVSAEIIKGNCSFVAKQANVQTYTAITQLGSIFFDGNDEGSSFSSSSAATQITCIFSVEEGDILISELS